MIVCSSILHLEALLAGCDRRPGHWGVGQLIHGFTNQTDGADAAAIREGCWPIFVVYSEDLEAHMRRGSDRWGKNDGWLCDAIEGPKGSD